jgi:transposase
MSITELKHVSEIGAAPARRIEVFTGAGRRRAWTEEEKAAIIAESYELGARASHVARRHGLTPQQLFAWRRAARQQMEGLGDAAPFVPAVAESAPMLECSALRLEPETKVAPILELEVSDAHIWVWRDAEVELVTALLSAH